MTFWLDIAAFALKALLIVAAIGGLAVLIARLTRRPSRRTDDEISIEFVNERLRRHRRWRPRERKSLLEEKERKALAKARKKAAKTTGDAPLIQARLRPRFQGRHRRDRGEKRARRARSTPF